MTAFIRAMAVVATVVLASCQTPVPLPDEAEMRTVEVDEGEGWTLRGDGGRCVELIVEELARTVVTASCLLEGESVLAHAYAPGAEAVIVGWTLLDDPDVGVAPGIFRVEVFDAPVGQRGSYFVAFGQRIAPEVEVVVSEGDDVFTVEVGISP